jgi:hypothetical protein
MLSGHCPENQCQRGFQQMIKYKHSMLKIRKSAAILAPPEFHSTKVVCFFDRNILLD